jgi:hypothetical protein
MLRAEIDELETPDKSPVGNAALNSCDPESKQAECKKRSVADIFPNQAEFSQGVTIVLCPEARNA